MVQNYPRHITEPERQYYPFIKYRGLILTICSDCGEYKKEAAPNGDSLFLKHAFGALFCQHNVFSMERLPTFSFQF